MKHFIWKLILILLPLTLIFILSFWWSINTISTGNYFKIPSNVHSVILGHSHSACAFDDKIIKGFYNLSQNTEGYPYTYFKAKKILEENKHVENIFVEYTNNQISPWASNRIYGIYLDINMPRIFSISNKRFVVKTFYKSGNPVRITSSIINSYKNNLNIIFADGDNYIDNLWHKHKTPTHIFNSDSTMVKLDFEQSFIDIYSIERENILYLFKIKELCSRHQVNLVFVRSPLPKHVLFYNEEIYRHIKDTYFTDIPLLDFKNYPLELSLFADDNHLNSMGRTYFSSFFANEIVQSANNGEVINNIIKQARTHNVLYK